MEPATKRDDEDRISQLPDPILHHILSAYFLETKHVVRTCVLSKRWRNLWASMPNLSLGDFELEDEEMNIEFLTFVNTLLLRREPLDVHSFCIYWSNDFDEHRPRHITTWTQYAVDHNVKKIQIFLLFGDLGDYEFPRCVFTCPTLEDLYLYIGGPLAVLPAVVSLGRLRKLHLECFTCRTILLSTLIYGCPVLEDLRLEYCKLEDADISSKSLKNLIINDCEFSGTRIQISVPSLQFLDVSVNDMLIQEVLLDNLSSVVEATFEIDRYYREPLNFVTPSTQSFYKLSKLRLDGWSVLENFPAVAHFLQHSPNLEMLTLKSYDRVCYKLYPTLKKWFVCSHRKIYLISQCGVENDRILELMTDFFSGKCGCFQD